MTPVRLVMPTPLVKLTLSVISTLSDDTNSCGDAKTVGKTDAVSNSSLPSFPGDTNLFGGTSVHFMYIRYQIDFYANLHSSLFVCDYSLAVSYFLSALTTPHSEMLDCNRPLQTKLV
jgi:hypothetical protein